ncbi:STAS domain-containing protein [Paludibaculum fermentans]|uniref:STAS domain-containing protein n=1 Tax=Paludibaculum fermentans TaxID=1473598 RepID=A0A7S7NKA6_PALFE|nr:STAS domain-containing protein [Paludibaculum fermentans]QOY85201.1 STAS domain-containing protein [Paludibaculum fermentans]
MELHQAASGWQWKISGTIEITDGDALHDALCGIVGAHSISELDLSEVSHCDPASLQLLCSAVKTANRLGGRLNLASPSPAVKACSEGLGLSLYETGMTEVNPGSDPPTGQVGLESGKPDSGERKSGDGYGT